MYKSLGFLSVALQIFIFSHATKQNEEINEIIDFYLYTKNDPLYPINVSNSSQVIDTQKETKIILHGWLSDYKVPYVVNMKNKYLQVKDVNVIIVDWGKFANQIYLKATMDAKNVGEAIGKFILRNKFPLDRIHIIGHSLGAHVGGFAGKKIKKETGKKIRRLTGLDPAGVLYDFPLKTFEERIDSSDAVMVDILHTTPGVVGMISAIGRVDFYSNGLLKIQPPCEKVDKNDNENDLSCSHGISNKLYIESIDSKGFVGRKCDNFGNYFNKICECNVTAIFGENMEENANGIYHFKTNLEPPYAMGDICG